MPLSSEKSIFLSALEKTSPAEREEFLAKACAGDPQLRASLQELLRAHDRSDNPLDEPPAELLAELGQGADGSVSPLETVDFRSIDEGPGTVIGPYKLKEQIGEGGFGLVFVAEQQQPVRRKVALKVIKPGMDTRDVIARFEAERQALALMDHPNIARVFDAGATDTGRPYFVMELVRGIPITEFCDQSQVTPPERLQLFLHLCQAVQHAHQKGIIHRDLKPSNVLVTLHDGEPVVKAIDFGIAKAVGQSLTEKTIYTRFAQMMGTPLYMSPEQAEMSGLDIDTRCDIYSLGVLLYELMTGTTPFDRQRIEGAAFDEIRRIIREEEPPRPSTRLTTLGQALSTVSAKRKTEARKLSAFMRGDLDWIVMKALEKDRSRRYETAAALASDVRRFLNHEPIEARPPSPLYRFRKLARRNKVMLTTTSLVAVALLLGTTISVWQAARAFAERNEREQARQDAVRAQNEANEARKEVEEFAERLKEANVLLTNGRALAYARSWPAAHADYTRATQLQPNYYNVWVERGALYVRLGLWKLAAADFAKACELGAPVDTPAGWGSPQLFLFVGDYSKYRESCLEMLQQADEKRPEANISVIRSCVIASTPVANPLELATRAEELLARSGERWAEFPFGATMRSGRPGPPPEDGPGAADGPRRPDGPPHKPPADLSRSDRPIDGPGRPPDPARGIGWYPRGAVYYVTGLAHYRAGQFAEAIARLRESQTVDPRWSATVGAICYPAMAMTYHRLGQADQARESLAAAKQAIDDWIETMLHEPVGTMPIMWFDWIECLLLYREANILITGSPPVDDPRLQAIEQRALSALQGGDAVVLP